MKKFLLSIATLAMAATMNAQTWTANMVDTTASKSIAAGITLVDNDNITAKTYYGTTISNETAWTIGSTTVDTKMNVRVDAWPTADNTYGTEKSGSTPVILTPKKDGSLTLYFRRQSKDGYAASDGKDVRVFQAGTALTSTAFEKVESVSEDDAYAHCTETFELEADKEYVVCAKGTTLGLMAFDYAVPETATTYELTNCIDYPSSWGWNNDIVDMGCEINATMTVNGNNWVINNFDGEGHSLDLTMDENGELKSLNNGTIDNYGYYVLENLSGKFYEIDVYVSYCNTKYAYLCADERGAYAIICGYFYDKSRGSYWGAIYLASGDYKTTTWAEKQAEKAIFPVSTTPAEGEVESLSTITLDWATDLLVGGGGTATVYNAAGEEVTKADCQYGDDWDKAYEMKVVLRSAITEPGTYSVVIPAGTFLLGEQGDTTVPEFTLTYTIKAPVTVLFSTTGYYCNAASLWGEDYTTYTDDELPYGFTVNVDVYSDNRVVLHNYLNSVDPAYANFVDVEIRYDEYGYSTSIGGSADASLGYGDSYKNWFYTGLQGKYWNYMTSTAATVWADEAKGYVYIYNWLQGADQQSVAGNYFVTWDPDTIAPYITSINDVKANAEKSVKYNIFGQRVNNAKGFMVQDGEVILK